MDHTRRDTYLPVRELLDRGIRYALAIEHRLHRPLGASADARSRLLQQALEAEQRHLTVALERYAAEAPHNVLDTVAQYSIALPDDVAALPEPTRADDLERWILDVHRPLRDLFAEVAEVAEATPAREPFENLAGLVDQHEMRIVQAAESAREL